jgi:pilus assembly protein CpaB
MNRNRLILIGVLAITVAGFVSFGVYRILQASIASARYADATVVAAAFDLPVGTRLAEKDLRLVRMPSGDLPSGYFRTTSELVGRGVVTPIGRNEIILTTKVAAENAGAGLPAAIPPGMRAVTVKVNDVIGVAGFAQPGTHVDVLLTGNPMRDNDPGNVTATTILQNIQVLAAGQQLRTNSDGKPQSVPVITLLVAPDEAQKLALATQEGRIQLTLRNPLDVDAENINALKNASLYHLQPEANRTQGTKNKIVKALPPPVAVYSVEMIRGAKRDVTTF